MWSLPAGPAITAKPAAPEQARMPLLYAPHCPACGRLHPAQPPDPGGPDGVPDGAPAQDLTPARVLRPGGASRARRWRQTVHASTKVTVPPTERSESPGPCLTAALTNSCAGEAGTHHLPQNGRCPCNRARGCRVFQHRAIGRRRSSIGYGDGVGIGRAGHQHRLAVVLGDRQVGGGLDDDHHRRRVVGGVGVQRAGDGMMPTELVAVPITPVTLTLATTVMSQPPANGDPGDRALTMVAPGERGGSDGTAAAPPRSPCPARAWALSIPARYR